MIACGHKDVWDYTPAQAVAYVQLANKRLRRERAQDLGVAALAARGKQDDIKSQIRKDWGD